MYLATTNALSRILYLLAQNPDAQTKLREEIARARGGRDEDLTYEELESLPVRRFISITSAHV